MSASRALVPATTPENLESFVNADIAAAFLGITRRTLLQKVRAGKIPGSPVGSWCEEKRVAIQTFGARPHLCAAINSFLQPT